MSEQIVELTKDSVAAEPSITANGALSMQAGIGFTLVGTNLYALFQRKDGANTFLVMPTDHEPSGGMTIAEMVDEINNLLNGAAPGSGTLNSEDIHTAASDVADASKKEGSNVQLSEIDWKSIKVCLKQAFLYLTKGQSAEYALSINFDTSVLFPAGQSFFNVSGLTIGIWNTERKKVLERMDLLSVDECLKELE